MRLTIADNGPGMPPEVLRRAFEPFFTTKPQGVGTGLGLAVCHGIITTHGGRIEVESEVGHGTRVELVLPLAGPAVPAILPARSEPAQAPAGRILVVDDEAEIAQLVADGVGGGRPHGRAGDGRRGGAGPGRPRRDRPRDQRPADARHGRRRLLRELRRRAPVLARSALLLTGDVLSASGHPELRRNAVTLVEKPVDLDELCRLVSARLTGEAVP